MYKYLSIYNKKVIIITILNDRTQFGFEWENESGANFEQNINWPTELDRTKPNRNLKRKRQENNMNHKKRTQHNTLKMMT